MCGIVADFAPGQVVDADRLSLALAAIRHRGPDGQGLWLSTDREVGLGHVRLAVLDATGSPQPIHSEDGQIVLLVNGEFYDHDTIRQRLLARGHRFRTGGDSEIALHLYEDYGPGFLQHLRGEFALILWDGRERCLLAARDRFGIKPLCYHQAGNRIRLASEAKALFALGVGAAWDYESLGQVCGMQYPPGNRTLFAQVSQLPPGCYLQATARGMRVVRYWDMDYPRESERPFHGNFNLASRELRERLDQAVRLRLRADEPVCFHLSGGLDSSSVVALASLHQQGTIDCFTVGFAEAGYDERTQAAETAANLGVRLHVVPIGAGDLLEHLGDAVWYSEGLAINGHLSAKYLLARAIRAAGFKVVLSGEGADEILGGYAHLRQDAAPNAGDRDQLRAINTAMAGIHLPEGPALALGEVQRRLGFIPTFLHAKATLGQRMLGVVRDHIFEKFTRQDPFGRFLDDMDIPGQLAGRHPVDQASYLWSRSALATYILRTLGDGTEMAHAVEGRVPFLDHELFAFVRTLPIEWKIQGLVGKFILREAMAEIVPDQVRQREKLPFTAPPLSLFRGPAQWSLLQDTIRSQAFAAQPFFEPSKLLRMLDDWPAQSERERIALDPVLMLALTASLLHQRFGLSG